MNKNAYDIAIKNHREQLFEDEFFRKVIRELMQYGNITEEMYIDAISRVCTLATIYKNDYNELLAKQSGEYSVDDKYEI